MPMFGGVSSPAIEAVGFVSELGDQPPLRVLCGTVIGAGLLRSRIERRRHPLAELFGFERLG